MVTHQGRGTSERDPEPKFIPLTSSLEADPDSGPQSDLKPSGHPAALAFSSSPFMAKELTA
jgi:hypothetical protein